MDKRRDNRGRPLHTGEVQCEDGRYRDVLNGPGEEIVVGKGQSISLTPYIAHVFGPKPGTGDCIIISDDSLHIVVDKLMFVEAINSK